MQDLIKIKGVGDTVKKKLFALGVYSVEDLLDRVPRQYVDLSLSVPLTDATDGSFCLFDGVVTDKSGVRKKGKLTVFSADVISGRLPVKLVWFNHSFVDKILNIGEEYTFFGKAKIRDYRFVLTNPKFEKKAEKTKFEGICPIYATKGTIGQGTYHNIVMEALSLCPESLVSSFIEEKYDLPTLADAYKAVHDPVSLNNGPALRRIYLERLTERIAAFRLAKQNSAKFQKNAYNNDVDFSVVLSNLPFELSPSQREATKRIFHLMKSRERMNSVLCGDVGSGKTVVAALAVYLAIASGHQAAVVAPTELLAKQHSVFFERFLSGTGKRVAYLVGSTPASEKRKIYEAAAVGNIDLIVGTHAVFSDKLVFADLALAVADEQHRFGVAQRNSLIEKGRTDILTLSATPIPRTMCLAAYGEAEFITIDRRVKGNIKTSIVPKAKREDMFRYLADGVGAGDKVYLVAPRISDAEGIERENCTELYEETCRYIDKGKVGLMHGKLKQEEKDAVMEDFRTGAIRALVATTVVEVGVDVPDASIIVITDADRFGLAALHQLRGRVGRNGQKSYCFLCAAEESERLQVLTESDDGFAIAERDFDMRGGGEIFGLEQSGAGSLKLDAKLLKMAKEASDYVDYDRHFDLLNALSGEFSLTDVTLG